MGFIFFVIFIVFSTIPYIAFKWPMFLSMLAGGIVTGGIYALLWRLSDKWSEQSKAIREKEAEEAKRKQLQELEAGTWVFPGDALREKCDALGIFNISSEANYQRAKLIAEEILRENNVPKEYFEKYSNRNAISAYFLAIQQSKQAEEQAHFNEQVQQLLAEEKKYQAECSRYANYVGRDKYIQYCQTQVTHYSNIIWQCEQNEKSVRSGGNMLYETGKGRESSWAVHGGIASGIAGGAAGVAVAADVQRKNAQVRQQNAQLAQSIGQLAAMSLDRIWKEKRKAEEQLEYWKKRLEKAKILLVEMQPEDKLLASLNASIANTESSPTGSMKVTLELDPDKLYIYGNTRAVVDGSILVSFYIGDRSVGSAICCLPYGGVTSKCEVSCICTDFSEHAEDYELYCQPYHLWAVEKV